MTQPNFEDRPPGAGLPEVADDDSPERARYPEPEEPALPGEDGYQGAGSYGTTAEEQLAGEPLDRRLAQEQPEIQEDPLRPREVDEPRDDVAPASEAVSAGQLVAPDEGAHTDEEKDEVALERGPADPADAGPESAALRVEDL